VRLLDTQVSIDRRITSGTCRVLVLSVWNMKMCLRVTELLSKTDVDLLDCCTCQCPSRNWFDITVDN